MQNAADSEGKPSTSSKREVLVAEEEENEPSTSGYRKKKRMEEKPIKILREGGEITAGKFMK